MTARRELVSLPSGGVLVDTAGMRELGLVEDYGGGDASFGDVAEAAGSCCFHDCAPGRASMRGGGCRGVDGIHHYSSRRAGWMCRVPRQALLMLPC